jgi:hypothetical protein
MYQQVNLYQPIFRKQRQIFSALTMAKVVAIFAAALAVFYVYGLWQVTGLEAEMVQLEGRERAVAAQLGRIDPTMGAGRRSAVEHELRELNSTLLAQQRLIEVLREQPLGTTEGFSGLLAALGRQHTSGLWLTDFAINGGARALTLGGKSVRAELIPEYLQRLGTEEAMAGQRFDELTIERDLDGDDVAFRVLSHAVALPEDERLARQR